MEVNQLKQKLDQAKQQIVNEHQRVLRDFDMRNSDYIKIIRDYVENLVIPVETIKTEQIKKLRETNSDKRVAQLIRESLLFINKAKPVLDKHQLDQQKLQLLLEREKHLFDSMHDIQIDQIVMTEVDRRLEEVTLMICNPFSNYFAQIVFKDPQKGTELFQSLIEQTYISERKEYNQSVAHSEQTYINGSFVQTPIKERTETVSSGGGSNQGQAIEDLIVNSVEYFQYKDELKTSKYGFIHQNLTKYLNILALNIPISKGVDLKQSTQCMIPINYGSFNTVLTGGDKYIILWIQDKQPQDQWKIQSYISLSEGSNPIQITTLQVLFSPAGFAQSQRMDNSGKNHLVIGGGNGIVLFSVNLIKAELQVLIKKSFQTQIYTILPLQKTGSWKHFITGEHNRINLYQVKLNDETKTTHQIQMLCSVIAHDNQVNSLIGTSSTQFISAGDNFMKIWTLNLDEQDLRQAIKFKKLHQCDFSIMALRQILNNLFITFHPGLNQGYSIQTWEMINDSKGLQIIQSIKEKVDELHAHQIVKNPDNPLDFMVVLLLRNIDKKNKKAPPTYRLRILDRNLQVVLSKDELFLGNYHSERLLKIGQEYVYGNNQKMGILKEDVIRMMGQRGSSGSQQQFTLSLDSLPKYSQPERRPQSKLTVEFCLINQQKDQQPFVQFEISVSPDK